MTEFIDTRGGLQVLLAVPVSALERFRLSADLGPWAQLCVGGLFLVTLALLFVETRRQRKYRVAILGTGIIGTALLCAAVLRPTELRQQGREVPGVAVLLTDASHRLALPLSDGQGTRAGRASIARDELEREWTDARLQSSNFRNGLLREASPSGEWSTSDLLSALQEVREADTKRPQSIVLFSDGRLTRPGDPGAADWAESLRAAAAGVPVHTVGLETSIPEDRSLRRVGFTGTAVAHQPFSLQIEVGCHPAALCADVEIVVRELLEGQGPVELARGKTKSESEIAKLDLELTLERAGGRVIEVEILGENDDAIPENDKRIVPVEVKRDRLRMLHVAGRPTYDVRALRMFLKADESIDLISFFILRTQSDQVNARQDELALIPFPVDELFTEHLKSFDAVILQDIDAPQYRLDRHFRSLRDYVLSGGGLILVGGPEGFSAGGYAGSPISEVLPVELPTQGELLVRKSFSPRYTAAGRAAPLLASLRATMGDALPRMSGANVLGRPKEDSLVLWEHPELFQPGQSGGEKMPVLALREVGDGRTIAISVDSTHELRFGEAGAATGGRAHADLWEGLLGWLMRDPRYESAQLRLEGECLAGRDQIVRVVPLPGSDDKVEVRLERLGVATSDQRVLERISAGTDGSLRFVARGLTAGGYAVRVKVGEAPPTRSVFACEAGGESWSDSRPDPARLRAIAEATGGQFVEFDEVSKLPSPGSTFIAVNRESRPLLSAWIWATLAAFSMSIHWVIRRAAGYA